MFSHSLFLLNVLEHFMPVEKMYCNAGPQEDFLWWVERWGGGGCCVKVLAIMVSRRQNVLKKHWLNALKQSLKKRNFDQNINDSKSHNFEFFFWKYYFGHTFLYMSRRVNMFLFSVRKDICTAAFVDAQELNS